MVSKKQIFEILAYLQADSGKEVRIEKVQVWHDQFSHLDFSTAQAAAKHLNVKGFKHWEPLTSDFREAVSFVSQKPSERITGDEAFNLAVGAVRRFGSYQEEAALKSLPKRIAHALQKFGFKDLCMAEEAKHGIYRAQFARIYDAASDRDDFDLGVKPQLTHTNDILKTIPAVQNLSGNI